MSDTQTKSNSLLKKVMKTRIELSKSGIKKTGENKFSKYKYYELEDFLPKLIELCETNGIATRFQYSADYATLDVIDMDNPQDVEVFSIPVVELQIQGAQKIQNLGGQITYLRRYLYMMAFDIAETSIVENTKEELSLTEEEEKLINEAETLEHLNVVCKDLIKTKGATYKSLILGKYNAKKEELGGLNDNS